MAAAGPIDDAAEPYQQPQADSTAAGSRETDRETDSHPQPQRQLSEEAAATAAAAAAKALGHSSTGGGTDPPSGVLKGGGGGDITKSGGNAAVPERPAVKQYSIRQLPQLLTLHLKRFEQVGCRIRGHPIEIELSNQAAAFAR